MASDCLPSLAASLSVRPFRVVGTLPEEALHNKFYRKLVGDIKAQALHLDISTSIARAWSE